MDISYQKKIHKHLELWKSSSNILVWICPINAIIQKTLNNLFHQFQGDVDLNSIVFLYDGKVVDGNISINTIINSLDDKRKSMSIIIL